MKKAEREYLAKVAEIGCIVCLNNGYQGTPAEIHHIRKGVGVGQRSSHFDAIPLCPFHHRNGGYGEAIHAGQIAFEKEYGTEAELLKQVQEMIK